MEKNIEEGEKMIAQITYTEPELVEQNALYKYLRIRRSVILVDWLVLSTNGHKLNDKSGHSCELRRKDFDYELSIKELQIMYFWRCSQDSSAILQNHIGLWCLLSPWIYNLWIFCFDHYFHPPQFYPYNSSVLNAEMHD